MRTAAQRMTNAANAGSPRYAAMICQSALVIFNSAVERLAVLTLPSRFGSSRIFLFLVFSHA